MRTELNDGIILIRPYRAGDIPLLYDAARESAGDAFTCWMPWCHEHYTIEESSSFVLSRDDAWQSGEAHDFAILDAKTHVFLGGVGLNQFNRAHRFANLGYWVRTSCMGRGIAVAATLLAARFAFEDLELRRVEIVAATGNRRSQRVAEKACATREGVLRDRLLVGDRLHDAVLYSLVTADLKRDREFGVAGEDRA